MNYEEEYKKLKNDVDVLIYLLTHDLYPDETILDRAKELSADNRLSYELGVYESCIQSAQNHISFFSRKHEERE